MPDSKSNKLVFSGVIVESLPDTTFRVELENKRVIHCYLAGRMRLHYIRVMPGDRVKIELSPQDLTRGRIIFREK